MQPVVAVLPELDRAGAQAVAAPVAGEGHVVPVGGLGLLEAAFERLTVGDDLALMRRPRAVAALERPRAEVRLRFGRVESFDVALDPYLAAQRPPVEDERGPRVLR